jgi:hypothetical protein
MTVEDSHVKLQSNVTAGVFGSAMMANDDPTTGI